MIDFPGYQEVGSFTGPVKLSPKGGGGNVERGAFVVGCSGTDVTCTFSNQ